MQIRGVAEATEGARLRAATATTPRAIKDSVFQIETKQQQQQKSRGILLAPPRTGQTVADLGPQHRSPFFRFLFCCLSLSLFTFFCHPPLYDNFRCIFFCLRQYKYFDFFFLRLISPPRFIGRRPVEDVLSLSLSLSLSEATTSNATARCERFETSGSSRGRLQQLICISIASSPSLSLIF